MDPRPPLATIHYLIGLALVVGVTLLAYGSTMLDLYRAWVSEPDYSHGFLVIPLALYFLYARRDRFPGWRRSLCWPGLLVLLASIGVRIGGEMLYVDAISRWSLIFWVAGAVLLLLGWRALWWAAPAIVFLLFMIPLPYRAERALSVPLQNTATAMSTWTLQLLGQPAIAEGNVIHIGQERFGVEEACSGLRIFTGILALCFAYIVLVRRAWWERLLLLVAVLPIALVANTTRIVVTCLLFQWGTSEMAHKFSHDLAGYFMIPYAAGLFALCLWYMGKLFPEVEVLSVGAVVRQERAMAD